MNTQRFKILVILALYRSLPKDIRKELDKVIGHIRVELMKEENLIKIGINDLTIELGTYLSSATQDEISRIRRLLGLFFQEFYGVTNVSLYQEPEGTTFWTVMD